MQVLAAMVFCIPCDDFFFLSFLLCFSPSSQDLKTNNNKTWCVNRWLLFCLNDVTNSYWLVFFSTIWPKINKWITSIFCSCFSPLCAWLERFLFLTVHSLLMSDGGCYRNGPTAIFNLQLLSFLEEENNWWNKTYEWFF